MLRKTARGFTLIELLIVIAVLGILAVAVLSAINPIEQINRSRDTGSKSDAEQLIGAVDRFYAISGYYPWLTGSGVTADALVWTTVGTGWTNGTTGVLQLLSSSGTEEVKESFTDRITDAGYNSLYVFKSSGQGTSMYVCFLPKSRAFETEALTRCTGGLPDDLDDAFVCAAGNELVCRP